MVLIYFLKKKHRLENIGVRICYFTYKRKFVLLLYLGLKGGGIWVWKRHLFANNWLQKDGQDRVQKPDSDPDLEKTIRNDCQKKSLSRKSEAPKSPGNPVMSSRKI